MQLCQICNEPAARQITSKRDEQTVIKCFCYAHAVEAGLLEAPLDLLNQATVEIAYPLNGIIFVIESLVRGGWIKEFQMEDGPAWTADFPESPLEICVYVGQAAVDRFQQQAGIALNNWKLRQGQDLAVILSWLARCGALMISSTGKESLFERLALIGGPLVVNAESASAPVNDGI